MMMAPIEKPQARRFDLFVTHSGGMKLRLRDEGVAPDEDILNFVKQGNWSAMRYSDIRSVTITSGVVRRGIIQQCAIAFNDGSMVRISDANTLGLPDRARAPVFKAFMDVLHQKLIASGAAERITFRSGVSAARSNVQVVAVVTAGLMFVLLPIILLAMTHQPKALLLSLFGVFLVVPLMKAAKNNRPARYLPDNPPDFS